MSEALYGVGGLRFWNEEEIFVREQAVSRLLFDLTRALQGINSAWTFHRIEGPLLTPRPFINAAYDDSDIFLTHAKIGDKDGALRAETTASSFLVAELMMKRGTRAPLCVWQVGKSFRRETNDGARASELRFNEFYQIEFQCIYSVKTTAPIREIVEPAMQNSIQLITRSTESRMEDSDRLPSYSTKTTDVMVPYGRLQGGETKWKEMASISSRTDFPTEGYHVLEVAVGLDRLVVVERHNAAGGGEVGE